MKMLAVYILSAAVTSAIWAKRDLRVRRLCRPAGFGLPGTQWPPATRQMSGTGGARALPNTTPQTQFKRRAGRVGDVVEGALCQDPSM